MAAAATVAVDKLDQISESEKARFISLVSRHFSGCTTRFAQLISNKSAKLKCLNVIDDSPLILPQSIIISTPQLGVPFFDKMDGMAAGEAPPSPNKAGQVAIDIPAKAAAGRADAAGDRGSNLDSAVLGIVAASSAVTMVAAGAVSPPVAFGLFVLLLGGLSLAVSGVRRA